MADEGEGRVSAEEDVAIRRVGLVHQRAGVPLLSEEQRQQAEAEAQRRAGSYGRRGGPDGVGMANVQPDIATRPLAAVFPDVVTSHKTAATCGAAYIIVDGREQNVLKLESGAEFNVDWAFGWFFPTEFSIAPDPIALRDFTIHFHFTRVDDSSVVEETLDLGGYTFEEYEALEYPFEYGAYLHLERLDTFGLKAGLYSFRPYIVWPDAKGSHGAFSVAPRDYFFLTQ